MDLSLKIVWFKFCHTLYSTWEGSLTPPHSTPALWFKWLKPIFNKISPRALAVEHLLSISKWGFFGIIDLKSVLFFLSSQTRQTQLVVSPGYISESKLARKTCRMNFLSCQTTGLKIYQPLLVPYIQEGILKGKFRGFLKGFYKGYYKRLGFRGLIIIRIGSWGLLYYSYN